MGRASSIARSRVPLHRRLLLDPSALRSWLLVLSLAIAIGALVAHAVAGADAARARWGRTRTVVVADRSIRAGESLDGAVRTQRWPAGLVPERALRQVPDGAWASGPLDAGVALTAASVEARASPALEGRRRLAVPLDEAGGSHRRGERVDLWSTTDPTLVDDGAAATGRVATGAIVVAADVDVVEVAVRPEEVGPVAEAVAVARVTVVGRP